MKLFSENKLSRQILKSMYQKDVLAKFGQEALRDSLSLNHLKEDFSSMTEGELNERFPVNLPEMAVVC